MNIKELLQKEVPLPINAIKKPFIWICNLKRYISFNLIAFIGWLDLLFFIKLYKQAINNNYYIIDIAFTYICITRIILFFLTLLFIIEKNTSFKIKQNWFICNNIYNIFFCCSMILSCFFTLIYLLLFIVYIFFMILFLS